MEMIDLLRLGAQSQASDLHLRPGKAPVLRIHGKLMHCAEPVLASGQLDQLLRAAMTPCAETAYSRHGYCDFMLVAPETRSRVHVFRQQQGMAAALRLIPPGIPPLATLGLPTELSCITHARQGLVLITGASGSGKSTTLAALIDHFNHQRASHILTLEDPIEFAHESRTALITQCDFVHGADSLRAALRQDPDIIMLGEMRDSETIALALLAAETGHLVLSTLHARTSADAVTRILGSFPASAQEPVRHQLSLSLRAVLAQTLVATANGGPRVLVHEILVATPAIRNLIRENRLALIESQLQTGRQHGMHTLRQCLDALVSTGRVDHAEAARLTAEWT
jgi:twitching motility protein PilT